MRLHPLALALLGGCHPPEYVPPPWDPPPRAVVELGCVEMAPALIIEGLGKVPGIPLSISFHSACKEPARLDLQRLRVVARGADGHLIELVPYDPRGEIHAGLLAPGDTSDERIEYDAAEGSLAGWTHVCVAFAGVLPDSPCERGWPICFTPAARLVDSDAVMP